MDLSGGGIRFTTEQEQKPDSWILAELRLKARQWIISIILLQM